MDRTRRRKTFDSNKSSDAFPPVKNPRKRKSYSRRRTEVSKVKKRQINYDVGVFELTSSDEEDNGYSADMLMGQR